MLFGDDLLFKSTFNFRVGIWETMLKRASFIINKSNYPEGFYIVVVVEPQVECGLTAKEDPLISNREVFNDTEPNRKKRAIVTHGITQNKVRDSIPFERLRITIKENSSISQYWMGTGTVSLGYILVFIFSFCIVKIVMNQKVDQHFIDEFDNHHALTDLRKQLQDPISENSINENNDMAIVEKNADQKCWRERLTDKTVDELCRCTHMENPDNDTSVYKRNKLHWVILILTSMFYYLPTIQMVLESSNLYKVTGNHDYCYYNSLCQRPLYKLRDFNHIFSNLGYAVLGLIFLWVVKKRAEYCGLLDKNRGIPRQYSLYYSMGISLIGIGAMSASYHVCPTNVTFQFDTTYMYLLAFFMFLKIYQNRHPDLVCSAFKGFLFLGLCLCLEVNPNECDNFHFFLYH